jgi:hypothetical protein
MHLTAAPADPHQNPLADILPRKEMVLWQLFNFGFGSRKFVWGELPAFYWTRLLLHNRFSSEVSLAVRFEGRRTETEGSPHPALIVPSPLNGLIRSL